VSGEQLQTEFQKLPVVEKLSGEDFVQACGFKVPAEPLEFAEGMRKDCGIYGPSSAEGAQLEGPAW
jgi:hypothetical protein